MKLNFIHFYWKNRDAGFFFNAHILNLISKLDLWRLVSCSAFRISCFKKIQVIIDENMSLAPDIIYSERQYFLSDCDDQNKITISFFTLNVCLHNLFSAHSILYRFCFEICFFIFHVPCVELLHHVKLSKVDHFLCFFFVIFALN